NKPGRSPVAPASVHSGGGGLLWSYAWTFSWLARCRSSKLPSENSLPSVMSSATSPPVENIPGHRDHRSGDHHPLITITPESRSRSFGIVDHHRPESAFIGSGSELAKLKTLVARLGVDGFVEFTGFLSHKQVCSYLSVADVCVAPDPL